MRPSAPAQACKHEHLSYGHGANTTMPVPSTGQVRGPGKTMYRWRLGASHHQSTAAAELRVSKRTLLAGLPGAVLGSMLTPCWPAAAESTSAGKPSALATCGACDVSISLGYRCRCRARYYYIIMFITQLYINVQLHAMSNGPCRRCRRGSWASINAGAECDRVYPTKRASFHHISTHSSAHRQLPHVRKRRGL